MLHNLKRGVPIRLLCFLALMAVYTIPSLAITVYYDNSDTHWEQPHFHCWGGGTSSTWPGTRMTQISGTNVWRVTVDGTPTGIQFNPGSNSKQIEFTSNINDGYVYKEDETPKVYASTVKYQMRGQIKGVSGWEDYDMTEQADGTWSISDTGFVVGTFGIKKVENGSQKAWYGWSAIDSSHKDDCIQDGDNIKLNKAGNYTISFNPTTSKISVVNNAAGTGYTYQLNISDKNGNNWEAKDMTKQADGTWKWSGAIESGMKFGIKEMNGTSQKAYYKNVTVNNNGNFTMTTANTSDANFTISGNLTLTFNPETHVLSVSGYTAPGVITYKIKTNCIDGTWASYDLTSANGSWSKTADWKKGEFLIEKYSDGTYQSNLMANAGTNEFNDNGTKGTGDSVHFKLNIEGNFKIAFTPSTGNVTVSGYVASTNPDATEWKWMVGSTEYAVYKIGDAYTSAAISITDGQEVYLKKGTTNYGRNEDDGSLYWITNDNFTESKKYGWLKPGGAHFQWHRGAKTIKFVFSYTDDNPFDVYATENVVVPPTPDDPVEFEQGYPRAYLLGAPLNGNVVRPDYRMERQGETMTFILKDFAMRSGARNNTILSEPKYDGSADLKVRVYYGPGKYRDLPFTGDEYEKPFAWDYSKSGAPGWGANATFTLDADNLPASTLQLTPAHGDDWNKNVMPFVSVLGSELKAVQKYSTEQNGGGVMGDTDMAWQESWIQYSAAGTALPNGDKVYYSTLWPPKNNVLFANHLGGEEPMGVSSESLEFRPNKGADGNNLVQSAAQWHAQLKTDDEYTKLNLPADNFIRLQCNNLWLNGQFKFWTGWNGVKKQKGNEEKAEWDNHIYFGPVGSNMDITGDGQYDCSLAQDTKDFSLSGANFYKTVDIFVPVNADGTINLDKAGDVRVYFSKPSFHPSIRAQKKNDTAQYRAAVELPEGYTISEYRIVRADYSTYGEGPDAWQPVDESCSPVLEEDATLRFGENLAMTADGFNTNFDKWIDDPDLEPGTYFYYLDITAKQGTDVKHAKVPSTWVQFLPTSCETNVRAYQLVQNGTSYVTYHDEATTQYDVTLSEDGKSVVSVTRRSVPFDYKQGLFSSLAMAVTTLPGQYTMSTADYKTVTDFTVWAGSEKAAELAAAANLDHEKTTFYVLHDYAGAGTLAADKTFKVTFSGKHGANEATADAITDSHPATQRLFLTVPVPTLGTPEFSIQHKSDVNAKVYNPVASGQLDLGSSVVNLMNATVPVRWGVTDAFRNGLAEHYTIKALTFKISDKAHSVTLADGNVYIGRSSDAADALVLEGLNPNEWFAYSSDDNTYSANTITLDLTQSGAGDFVTEFYGYGDMPQSYTMKMDDNRFYTPDLKLTYERKLVKTYSNFMQESIIVKTLEDETRADADRRTQLGGCGMNDCPDALRYLIMVDGKPVTPSTQYSNGTPDCVAHRLDNLRSEEHCYTIATSHMIPWYAEIYNNIHCTMPTLQISVANLFETKNTLSGKGGVVANTRTSAPRRAEADATLTHVFRSLSAQVTPELKDIVTGVDEVTVPSAAAMAGAGFVTLGEGMTLYNVSGIAVASGEGRHELPAGVYVATDGVTSVKLVVR